MTLASNPHTDDFLDGVISAEYFELAGQAASASIVEAAGALTFHTDPDIDNTWAGDTAPRLRIPISDDVDDSDNFYCTFQVTAVTLTLGVGAGLAAGGVGIYKSTAETVFTPIIEWGGAAAGNRAYHSDRDVSVIGGKADIAIPEAPTFWVRVVRIDNVIYGEWVTDNALDTPPTVGWANLVTDAANGSIPRSDATPGSMTDADSIVFYARSADAASYGIDFSIDNLRIVTWDRYSSAVPVGSLKATTEPEGLQIDLSWANPAEGVDEIRHMEIYRSKYGHPEYKAHRTISAIPDALSPSVFGEQLYSGVPKATHSDTLVKANQHYYYTIFTSRAPLGTLFSADAGTLAELVHRPSDTDWGPQARPQNKVTGLSIENYLTTEGSWLYDLFPALYTDMDQQEKDNTGAAVGYLENFSRFLQGGFDLLRGMVTGLTQLYDPDAMPLGLIGDSAEQTSIVDAYLRDKGINPNAPGLDAIGKRRLFGKAVESLKVKGSPAGACSFAQLVSGWQPIICSEPGLGSNLRLLRTWDGYSNRNQFDIEFSLMTPAAGSLDGFTGLSADQYVDGLYFDWLGNLRVISANDTTSVTFDDATFTPAAEVVYAGATVSGGDTITLAAPGPNDDAYNGAQAWCSNGGLDSLVLDVDYATGVITTAGGLTNGACSVAFAPSFSGASYAARSPDMRCWLMDGEHSWIYEPRSDLTERGTEYDPFYTFFTGLALLATDVYLGSDTDFLLTAPAGAAKHGDEAVAGSTTTTIDLVGTQADVVEGDYINPNRNFGEWFRIQQLYISGPNTRYVVAPSLNGLVPSDVSLAGNVAIVAPRITVERDRLLRALMPLVMPYDSSLFIYYI